MHVQARTTIFVIYNVIHSSYLSMMRLYFTYVLHYVYKHMALFTQPCGVQFVGLSHGVCVCVFMEENLRMYSMYVPFKSYFFIGSES